MQDSLLRMHLKGKKLPARLPRQIPPTALERAYKLRVKAILDKVMAKFRLHGLPKIEQLASYRQDTLLEALSNFGSDFETDVKTLLTLQLLLEAVKPIAVQIASYQAQQLNRQLHAVIGVDAVGDEPWLNSELNSFIVDNVTIIRGFIKDFISKIEQSLAKNLSNSESFEHIVAAIEDIYTSAVDKIKAMTANQTETLYADLNEKRQADLGIDKFVWVTQRDERVRPTHAARDGKIMTWKNPIGGILPGEEWNCRCEAEPYLGDLADKI
jgi:SPP1 gp7 family putative phage head morphogenesis protein